MNIVNSRLRFRSPVDLSMLTIPSGEFTIQWNINFANAIGKTRSYIKIFRNRWANPDDPPSINYSSGTVYNTRTNQWTAYEDEIVITGGTDVANTSLIAFLEGNAEPYDFYRADKQDLIAVADAIRSKGGTSAPLTFPDGFITAIGDITTPIPSNYGLITYNGSILTVS